MRGRISQIQLMDVELQPIANHLGFTQPMDGVILLNQWLYVLIDSELRRVILEESHNSPVIPQFCPSFNKSTPLS